MKWKIIEALSRASDKTGNLLLQLMDYAGTTRLMDVTEQQAVTFAWGIGMAVAACINAKHFTHFSTTSLSFWSNKF